MAKTSSLYCQHRWQIWRLRRCWKKCCGICQRPTIGWCNDTTAPFVGIMTNGPSNGGGALGWQLVVQSLALALVKNYGKQAAVAKLRPHLERHLNYLLAFDFDYIAQCCLGDWGAIDETQQNGVITSPDQSFCSACMYLLLLQRYQELIDLRIIGNEDYCQRVTAAIQYTTANQTAFSKGNEAIQRGYLV